MIFVVVFLLLLSIPFLILFSNLVLRNRRKGPRHQSFLALCAFFNRGNTEGTKVFENFVFDVCACFVLCKFVSGLILWFSGNLWFDDSYADEIIM